MVVTGLSLILYGSRTVDISGWRGDIWALYVSLALASTLTIARHLKHISMIPAIPIAYLVSATAMAFFINPFYSFEANNIYYLCHGSCIAKGVCFLALGLRYLSTTGVSLLIL